MENFTVADAIEVQTRQLAEWKLMLKGKVYKDLKKYLTEANKFITKPSEIMRGTMIDAYLSNYLRMHKKPKFEVGGVVKLKNPDSEEIAAVRYEVLGRGLGKDTIDLRVIGKYESGHVYPSVDSRLMDKG